jgi:hypothetical protein
MPSTTIIYTCLGRTLWHTRQWPNMLAALSFPAERKPPLPKLQMWNSVLSMRQYSRLLPNFRFRFVCARAFTEDLSSEIHRDRAPEPAPHAITLLHVISLMGTPLFDGGTEADSGPNGNRTTAGPLGAKHAPVAQHCHLGQVVDLFVQ